jgi:tripeptidyl-peptidase-1
MLLCILLCSIFFTQFTYCDSKTSKWWESFVPVSEENVELVSSIRSDSALFKQLNEAVQPISKPEKFIHMGKSLDAAIEKFQLLGNSDSKHVHQGIIFIKQKNLKALEDILYAVSDPHSIHYGNHLSHVEVTSITADLKSIRHVTTYLKRKGFRIVDKSLGLEFLTVEAPVSVWESTLNTQFFHFQSTAADGQVAALHRAKEYSLPAALHAHVTTIFNIIDFPDVEYFATHITKTIDAKDIGTLARTKHGFVTPEMLNSFYDVRNNTGNHLSSQGVFETLGQSFSPVDLKYFQTFFGLAVEPVAADINGHESDRACRQNEDNCIEANLDVQYMMAMAQHVPTTYYYWGGKDFVLDWVVEVSKMASPPLVISISYGADERGLPASYADTFNVMAMKLGVRGVTITASSGDDGALSSSVRKNPMHCGYSPSFPATSPFVTAVGGTQVSPANVTLCKYCLIMYVMIGSREW